MSIDIFLNFLQQFGPLAGILLFFLWRDWKRSDAMALRVEKLEDGRQNMLVTLVEKSTQASVQNAASLDRVSRTLERICDKLAIVN